MLIPKFLNANELLKAISQTYINYSLRTIRRFVAFISGSFAAVLALITIFDQELLLGLEITTDRTVFFYLGLFGTIMAVSRGMIPDQTESFDPELLIRGVVEHTHYMPSEWEDKLHTDEVHSFVYYCHFLRLYLRPHLTIFI